MTNRNIQQPKSDQPPEDSTLVPMLIAGLILVIVGYGVIMLFV